MKKIKKLTEAMISAIIEDDDQARYASQGGYSSVWKRVGRSIVVASVDHDDAPTLDVYSNDGAFLNRNGYSLEDHAIKFGSGVLKKIETPDGTGFNLFWMTEDEANSLQEDD